jgi:trimeric autotransporter adhesin
MRGRAHSVVVLSLGAISLGAVVYARSQSPASSSPAASASQFRQIAYLKASNPLEDAHFGCGGTLTGHAGNASAVSQDGSTIAIGAPHENSSAAGINGNQNDHSLYSSGAVYVFTRRGTTLTQQAYVKASNPGDGANFGSSVVLSRDGNTMAVAAYYESSNATGINGNEADHSIPEAGAVYIFTRTGGTWSQQAYIKASNTGNAAVGEAYAEGDQFGYAIALSSDGNTLAVGAIGEDSNATGINGNQDDNSANQAGAAYVFTRNGSSWSQQAYIKSSMTRPNVLFGYSLGISANGDTLAVGEYDADRGKGALYVLTRTGTVWSHQARIQAENGEIQDSLGYSLALSEDGNTIASGAADEDCLKPGVNPAGCENDQASNTSSGAAYVFVRNGSTWTQQAFLKASNPGKEDWFGVRIAISGDGNTVAVSAPNEDSAAKGINGRQDDESAQEAGAVYVFTRTGTTWVQHAYVKASNTRSGDEFGSSIGLTRDGRTMIVGARGEDSGAKGVNGNQADVSVRDAGAAYLFAR